MILISVRFSSNIYRLFLDILNKQEPPPCEALSDGCHDECSRSPVNDSGISPGRSSASGGAASAHGGHGDTDSSSSGAGSAGPSPERDDTTRAAVATSTPSWTVPSPPAHPAAPGGGTVPVSSSAAALDDNVVTLRPDPSGWDQSPAHPPLYSPPHPHQYSNGPPGTPPHLQGFSNGLAGASPPHAPQHGQPQQQQQQHQQQRLYQGAPQPNGGGPRSPGDEPMDVTDADADGDGDACGGADEEPGLREPRVNAQGKVKTYRCKQCNYVAITKLDFWDHSRSHIKIEKMLTCPRCPFVTEYKHHLEYHLRNHSGSKPFKCDKCPYTCVNKSMLNSHMKSHSSVYQYRCADCTYATKYMHSLKLHLRKYTHKPAMVLNPDGSPNPLPIIDVYGTRRGPKSKPHPLGAKGDLKQESNNNACDVPTTVAPQSAV
ncbi:Protein hunchback [Gryllus bimaculatus]|nr:Protein hunchback [Gryllus bimaculatus]